MAKGRRLAGKRLMFALEYCKDFNGTAAAIRAGYSESAARATASALLTNPDIQEHIAQISKRATDKAEVTVARVVREYARIAFADIKSFVTYDGAKLVLKKSDELTPDESAAVMEIQEGQWGVKFKLHSKTAALEALGRHLGMFDDKLELKVKGSLEEMLTAIRGRVSESVFDELMKAIAGEMGVDLGVGPSNEDRAN